MGEKEPQESIMPYPICPKCGQTIHLDAQTYTDYEGPITCVGCKAAMRVKIGRVIHETGDTPFLARKAFYPNLEWVKPLVDADLLQGLLTPAIPKEIYDDYEAALYCFGA